MLCVFAEEKRSGNVKEGQGGMYMTKKIWKRMLSVVVILAVVLQFSTSAQAGLRPKLNKTKITLTLGNTVDLHVRNTTKSVRWSSNKPSVASVSSDGDVTAVAPGKAKITAKVAGKKLTCRVTVPKQGLSAKSVTIMQGKSKKLVLSGVTAQDTVFWCSDDEDVASVSQKGVIKAKQPGETIVSAILNSGLGETYECKVKVTWDGKTTPTPEPTVAPTATPTPTPTAKPSASPLPTASVSPTPTINPDDYYNGQKIAKKFKSGIYQTLTVDASAYFSATDLNVYVINTTSSNRGIAAVDKIINNKTVMIRTYSKGDAFITLICNGKQEVVKVTVEQKPVSISKLSVQTPGISLREGDKIKIYMDLNMENAFKSATMYFKNYDNAAYGYRASVLNFEKDKTSNSYVGELTVTKEMKAGMWGLDWCMVQDAKGYVDVITVSGTVHEFADTFYFYVR